MTTIWTPTRNLSAVRDFVKALHEVATEVAWVETADDAELWIIDGSLYPADPRHVRRYAELKHPPRVAYLAHRFSDLPHAGWAFFKTPVVNPQLIRQLMATRAGSAGESRALT